LLLFSLGDFQFIMIEYVWSIN